MSRLKIALKYSLFAVAATMLNISAQWISGLVYDGTYSLYVGMIFGTGGGLLLKYHLDKKYIFDYYVKSKMKDVQTFIIYTFTGVATTAVFWGFEIAFHFFFSQNYSKYFGAVTGLSIGYFFKYLLDKKFVFR